MNVQQHIGAADAGLLKATRPQLHVDRFLDALREKPVVIEAWIAGRKCVALAPRVRPVPREIGPPLEIGVDAQRRTACHGQRHHRHSRNHGGACESQHRSLLQP